MLGSMDSTPHSPSTPAADAASPAGDRDGRVVGGKYRILGRLGRGGRGEVFRAMQLDLDREVALKLVMDTDEDARARFLHEARVAARIRHPSVVEIFDAGVDADGTPYCAMELLDGETLAARIEREGRLAPADAVALVAGVASALTAVHAAGFLHRDVKPGNVFLARRPDGGVDPKLIDFGIAKRTEVEPDVARKVTLRGLGKVRGPKPTLPGVIVGTPCYLAPEQVTGDALDKRTDVYGLAATLYEALAGAPPFPLRDMGDLLIAIVTEVPQAIAGIPAELDREVRRGLAKDPAARHASAADLAAALWAALATARISGSNPPAEAPAPPSRGPLVFIAGALALLATLGVIRFGQRAPAPPPAPVIVAAASPTAAPAPPPSATSSIEPEGAATAPPQSPRPDPKAKGARPAATSRAPFAPSAEPSPAPAPTATSLRIDDLKAPF
jgi:serine/threonine-protein kinase